MSMDIETTVQNSGDILILKQLSSTLSNNTFETNTLLNPTHILSFGNGVSTTQVLSGKRSGIILV